MIRECVLRAWNPPTQVPADEKRKTVVKYYLNRDGSLQGKPIIVKRSTAAFGASVLRAIRRCHQSGELRLPAGSYEDWREVIITFDPNADYF